MPHPIRVPWFTRKGWSEFGAWRRSGGHKGFDYYVPEGTPIYGTGNGGRVTHIGYNMSRANGFGHSVRIAYPGRRQTIDAHMKRRTPLKYGQSVNSNTVVGHVGRTGNAWRVFVWATLGGKYRKLLHLHHEVSVNGALRDPITFYGPAFSGGESTTITNRDYDDMRLVRRNDTNTPEWSLFHPTFRGPSSKERGYYLITNADEATDWARLLYKGAGTEQSEPRDVYVRMQESARKAYANYARSLPAPSAPTEVNVDLAQVIAAIPTAAENGQAARDAIVK